MILYYIILYYIILSIYYIILSVYSRYIVCNILLYTYTHLFRLISYLINFVIGMNSVRCGANLILIHINLTTPSHNAKAGFKITSKIIAEICKADARVSGVKMYKSRETSFMMASPRVKI